MKPRRLDRKAGAATLLALAGLLLSVPSARASDLEEVLANFDEAQIRFHSLSADFVQVTENALFKDPIEARGRLYMTKPNSIRWDYDAPEPMRFVIAKNVYTGYFPEQKRAEQSNIQRYSKHLFRMFGVGQGSIELRKFYNIERRAEGDTDDALLLVMSPKKKRARKLVEDVWFWIDGTTFLPVRMEARATDGSGRTIEFHNVKLDPDLAASLYEVDIPADVEVTKGFSGLPDFDPATQ